MSEIKETKLGESLEDINIVMVLDRSGSMQSCVESTIEGYNTLIAEQKKVGNATASLYQFDNIYEAVYESLPIEDVEDLNAKTFVPRSSTALYDAICKTIIDTKAKYGDNPPSQTLFVILTDGGENSSMEFNREAVKKMVGEQTDADWQFIYVGANQDAIETGSGMGIMNSINYMSTPAGSKSAFDTLSGSVTNYRGVATESKSLGDLGTTEAFFAFSSVGESETFDSGLSKKAMKSGMKKKKEKEKK